jgi:CheY-like chemotaxis protein
MISCGTGLARMSNILVVEDNVQVAKLFRDTLTRAAHQVVVKANGNEALQALEQQAFDLVITDIFMPEKDGLELIREIRAHKLDIKVIAISGGGKSKAPLYLEMAKKLGASRTLNKPFELKELLQVVEETIGSREK